MYKYKIKSGAEGRVFSEEGIRHDPDDSTVLISDRELTSPYLTPLNNEQTSTPQAQTTATTPPPATPAQAPAPQPAPAAPQNPQTQEGVK